MTPSRILTWLRGSLAVVAICGACSGGDGGGDAGADAGSASQPSAALGAASGGAPAAFTAADLDGYERGFAREIELVRAAQERQRTATTPQARGEAMQAQRTDQTIPEGARSAGMSAERYQQVRESVHGVLRTLDFQGKIDGPMRMDTARATPEMRRQLASDPLAELPPASAAALRERLDRLAPPWSEYARLTAVGG